MANIPWYKRYSEYSVIVKEAVAAFESRCQTLGLEPHRIREEVGNEAVARMVHESNWQEDLYLNLPRTKELAELAFQDTSLVTGPHLDFAKILDSHRGRVLKLKRGKKSIQEIAAYNLATAHQALKWIRDERRYRGEATIVSITEELAAEVARLERSNVDVSDAVTLLQKVRSEIENLRKNPILLTLPLNQALSTEGQLFCELEKMMTLDSGSLFNVDYVHLLHRLTTMGLIKSAKCGVFRKGPVFIEANPDLVFPPAGAVDGLMRKFCDSFPPFGKGNYYADPIMAAARVSHRFVVIHPYADGNGRVSRLLMNLVLLNTHLPVPLKADSDGRHKYIQAIRRADNGNLEPMACLIARSLIEAYNKTIRTLSE
jgi:fido (protein-threonine AMPylation protein)